MDLCPILSILQNPSLAKRTLNASNRNLLILMQILLERGFVETQELNHQPSGRAGMGQPPAFSKRVHGPLLTPCCTLSLSDSAWLPHRAAVDHWDHWYHRVPSYSITRWPNSKIRGAEAALRSSSWGRCPSCSNPSWLEWGREAKSCGSRATPFNCFVQIRSSQ